MQNRLLFRAGFIALALTSFTVQAAQRTFVSTDGSDANTAYNCSLVKPCRSFAAAMGMTDSNGEIVVRKSGGYGAVSINKSISIIAPDGVYAGISAFPADTNGITLATAGITVLLRGLTINSMGATHGIRMTAGTSLSVENCVVNGFTSGSGLSVESASQVKVIDSLFQGNDTGAHFSAGATVTVSNTRVLGNGTGHGVAISASGSGIETVVTIDSSVINENAGYGVRVIANSSGVARVHVNDSMASHNGFGGIRGDADGGTAYVNALGTVANANSGNGFEIVGQNSSTGRMRIEGGGANHNSTHGVWSAAQSSGFTHLEVDSTLLGGNTSNGIYSAVASGGTGRTAIKGVNASGNQRGITAYGTGGTLHATVSDSLFSANTVDGIQSYGSPVTLVTSGNTVTGNAYGLSQEISSVFRSDGTNRVRNNTTANTFGTITTVSRI